jgi:hypothetical protein
MLVERRRGSQRTRSEGERGDVGRHKGEDVCVRSRLRRCAEETEKLTEISRIESVQEEKMMLADNLKMMG